METETQAPASATAQAIIVRQLPADEFHRLQGVGLFEKFALPNMEHMVAVVAQNSVTGEIVGYWLLFDAVHVEPLWIKEELRKKPGLARRLWGAVASALVEKNVPIAFACIADNDAAQNLPAATRLGFQRLPGGLYFIEVKPEAGTPESEGWKSAGDQVREQLLNGGPPE